MSQEVSVRRCSICGLTYNDSVEFRLCEQCGQETKRITTEEENPSLKESRALVSRLRGERYALASDEALRAEALVKAQAEADDRAAHAGAAAINYDADNEWLTFEGPLEDWVSGIA